jgi:hypothetical protein
VLKLTRKTQQGVVIHPLNEEEKALVIRVIEIVPGTTVLGFEGEGYKVIRSEIFNRGNDDSSVCPSCKREYE